MVTDDELNAWFRREVLPLERALASYFRRNWSVAEDLVELRQDIYERALIGAKRAGLPANTRAYLFTLARNHLINQVKRARIVSFETIADLDTVGSFDIFETERALTARDELRHAKAGIDKLPPRCREVIRLRKLDGLSTQEAADVLGVTTETIRQQLKYGMKALIDHMLGGSGKIVRPRFGSRSSREAQS